MGHSLMHEVEGILSAGTLRQKHREIGLFLESGNSMLFDGEIDWRLFIPQEEKILSGSAESIDHAFGQVHVLLEGMMEDMDPQTPVSLSVKTHRHD